MRNPFKDGGPLGDAAAAAGVLAVSAVLLTVQAVSYPDGFNPKYVVGAAVMGLISFGAFCWEVSEWIRSRRERKHTGC